jgi:hypothetical protein
MALADQRAIEVGTLKTEIKRLQRVIESSTGPQAMRRFRLQNSEALVAITEGVPRNFGNAMPNDPLRQSIASPLVLGARPLQGPHPREHPEPSPEGGFPNIHRPDDPSPGRSATTTTTPFRKENRLAGSRPSRCPLSTELRPD